MNILNLAQKLPLKNHLLFDENSHFLRHSSLLRSELCFACYSLSARISPAAAVCIIHPASASAQSSVEAAASLNATRERMVDIEETWHNNNH